MAFGHAADTQIQVNIETMSTSCGPIGGHKSVFGQPFSAFIVAAGAWLILSEALAADLSNFAPCHEERLPERLAETAQCATITVPEDKTAPDGRQLVLPVLKIPAAEGPGVPVFVLNGGPGDPNVDGIRQLGAVEAGHDVLYVGYRGADGSMVLECPEVDAALADVPAMLSRATLARFSGAAKTCAKRLQDSGINLSNYTILDVVDDLEAVRAAAGYDKVNLISISYGTRVAQFYARVHPERIFRSIMIGANPPGHFIFSAYVNDKVLARHSELCAADPVCAARTPDLRRTILNALDSGGKIDDGRSRAGLFFALYNRDVFQTYAKAAIAAENGDWSGLEELGKVVPDALRQTVWGDILSKGVIDSYRYAGLAPTFGATDESMGSPMDMVYGAFATAWPMPPLPAEFHRPALDMTETLIVNGDLDVATPALFAEADLMPYLPNGQLLPVKDYGHDDIRRQIGAFDRIFATYLATGAVDGALLKEDPWVFPE